MDSTEASVNVPTSETKYMGTIGQRGDFFVKFTEIRHIARLDCWAYNFIDRDQKRGMFFSNVNPTDFGVAKNDCVLMKMTPKAQEINSYTKEFETKFNRPKIVKNVGAKKPEGGTVPASATGKLTAAETPDFLRARVRNKLQ